jgi:TPP-dependent pyruvate/acetoin dehydrogenase alpha subunit
MSHLSREKRVELYRFMRLNRAVEERLVHLYRQGKILGGFYRSLGQEATSVGSAAALADGDIIGPLIRNLGSVLVMGFSPRTILLQHMGRRDGPSRGKDGNLHFGTPETGMVSPISMLGALVPVMAGIALGARLLGKRTVAMTYIGDGATSTGAFHEGINFAAVQNLPLVVIVENNGWAYSTPVSKQTRARNLADKAAGYGIPGEVVDGNDVEAVYEVTSRAVARAREDGGPTLIEAKTYRMKGHAEHDPQAYVPRVELEEWSRRDPLARYSRRLLESGLANADELARIDAAVARQLDEDVAAAERAALPDGAEALDGVYARGRAEEPIPAIIRMAETRR